MSHTLDFGIDLGTTNSSIAVCRRGEVSLFQTNELMNVTPSVVYINRAGRMLVGKKAYDVWVQDPENTQAEFKRWMGYKDSIEFPASGKKLSAEELSAEVLKSLRADAERQTQERVTGAVITVPAAFGSLQCEATARAARLAGLDQSPLLQEPIAAAVAYGASPSAQDQRWMVFDLGGGTLDIAIVSTRNGQLSVLDHQGNNRLGGKDIDRLIAEKLLLEPLSQTFRIPDRESAAKAYERLFRQLVRHAEQAKIALSMSAETTVDLFDLGDDADGTPMELSIPITRSAMETTVTPVLDQCLSLARRAMEGARLTGADLDRILLVGGPTQMPIIRSTLASELKAKLDHSLDPMTVVARGAALYASTLDRELAAGAVAAPAAKTPTGTVEIKLAHERASGTRLSPVAGVMEPSAGVHEVKIDAAGGFWTSGWISVADGGFQTEVMLHDVRPVTGYTLSARDRAGRAIAVTPAEFSIAFMLPMGAPPLPHTIALELSTTNGVTSFDPVFARHCPLPAEARKTYRADRTLRPSEIGETLPIKFWEIDVSDDPQEKWWAGCVHVQAERIKRPIPEGSDLELTIKIDASRRLSVELFVPILNESFSDDVYVPDPPTARSQLQQQIDLCFERLNALQQAIFEQDREDLEEEAKELQLWAEQIAVAAGPKSLRDPDAALAPTEALRKLRVRLARLEEQAGVSAQPTVARNLRWAMPYISRIVQTHGSDLDRQEFDRLESQYERYSKSNDTRGLTWLRGQVWRIHNSIVENEMWFWQSELSSYKRQGRQFLNQTEATKLLADAEQANSRNDMAALRSTCRKLYDLTPKSQLESAGEQSAESGLRAT